MIKANFFLLSASVLAGVLIILSCSSELPELPPPIYDFCVYQGNETCTRGPATSCPDGGIPSYNCPYQHIIQSSSSVGEPEQESSSSTGTNFSNSSSSLDSPNSSSSLGSPNSSSSLNISSSSSSSSSSQKPALSLNIPNSGHYASSFSFTIPSETEQGIIRCEKNGSEPTSASQLASGSELSVTATTILRCAQFKNGIATDPSVMRTYIIGERLPQLPVFSIVADPITFTSSGIYPPDICPGMQMGTDPCKDKKYWLDTTVLIHIDFFEAQADHKWSYPAGLKIMGGWSRANPKKSVKINFKEKFGQKNLKYSLFPEYPNLTKFKGFALRSNGNNWDKDYIRDMLATTLTKGLGIDYQKGRYAIVYYNGKYYGIHNLRERSNEDYYDTNYGISDDNLDLIKNLDTASVGSMDDYNNLMNWLESVRLDDTNLNELEKRIDLNNFTNYFQSEIYFDNRDWPGNNVKIWRTKSPPSKYKWFLYDVDFGFGASAIYSDVTRNCSMMDLATDDGSKSSCHRASDSWPIYPKKKPTLMLRRLLDNANYRNSFINRFSLLLATYYAPARVSAQIDALMNSIPSAEITLDRNKWGYSTNDLSTIRSFANSRANTMNTEIKNYFKLSTPVDFTISVEGSGEILVHGLPVLNRSATFKAYPEVPIELEASGSGFTRWSDGITTPKRTVDVSSGITTLSAEF
ncbi:hypothetical protein R83H12_01165 [Fibrobacteria bacterium R8-3-H12]